MILPTFTSAETRAWLTELARDAAVTALERAAEALGHVVVPLEVREAERAMAGERHRDLLDLTAERDQAREVAAVCEVLARVIRIQEEREGRDVDSLLAALGGEKTNAEKLADAERERDEAVDRLARARSFAATRRGETLELIEHLEAAPVQLLKEREELRRRLDDAIGACPPLEYSLPDSDRDFSSCSHCGVEMSEPHSWKDCAAGLVEQRDEAWAAPMIAGLEVAEIDSRLHGIDGRDAATSLPERVSSLVAQFAAARDSARRWKTCAKARISSVVADRCRVVFDDCGCGEELIGIDPVHGDITRRLSLDESAWMLFDDRNRLAVRVGELAVEAGDVGLARDAAIRERDEARAEIRRLLGHSECVCMACCVARGGYPGEAQAEKGAAE